MAKIKLVVSATIEETYSDDELAALLKKPDIRKATFSLCREELVTRKSAQKN